ncbi:MAG: bile acid:sodium symporter [Flavobacterium sp.]|nr:MAG: bile acid:sodium symporter [Flavobacterium sp.]
MKLTIDPFVLAIIGIIITAYIFPQWGSSNNGVPLDLIGSIGISLIFFFYGLKLSAEKIKLGLQNWKLHVLVQLTTFVIFPLIILLFHPFIQSENGELIWLSFLFLAALPSTVSSSVVMVSMAKGNVPAAIFNASISGLIGIAITPLWMGLFLNNSSTEFELGSIYLKLVTEILVPVVLGIAMQKYGSKYANKYAKELSIFDKSIILLIIYKSFAESFEENVFTSVDIIDLLFIGITTTLLFYAVFHLTGLISKTLKFSTEDQITAQFCGTKKSLVHGTIFSKILFPTSMPIGIILLPLMLFHASQIFIISIIASKLAQRTSS